MVFTFHNVSINSMFPTQLKKSMRKFTFHNVSINSKSAVADKLSDINLHSTMFLLILFPTQRSYFCQHYFTFHNVSINSKFLS